MISLAWCLLSAFVCNSYGLEGRTSAPEKAAARERVVIISTSEFSFQGKHFTSVVDLETHLKELAAHNSKLPLLIVGADQEHFGIAVIVLDACRKAGFSDIKIDGA